ncbi:unnamed protein product [Musa acuminata subsp. burmannicoides]
MRCLNHARASHEKKRAKGSQGQTCQQLANKEILLQGNAGKSSLAAFHSLPLHAKPSASIFIPLFPSSSSAIGPVGHSSCTSCGCGSSPVSAMMGWPFSCRGAWLAKSCACFEGILRESNVLSIKEEL